MSLTDNVSIGALEQHVEPAVLSPVPLDGEVTAAVAVVVVTSANVVVLLLF